MKQQLNVRVSKATREKIDFLVNLYGTQAEALAVAIDRLYQWHQNELHEKHPGYISDSELEKGGDKMNCSICGALLPRPRWPTETPPQVPTSIASMIFLVGKTMHIIRTLTRSSSSPRCQAAGFLISACSS